jgi:hypothetical protein
MQITVDTEKDSPAVLSNVGKFLVLGYGSLADKIATVAGAQPQPGAAVTAAVPLAPKAPPAPDFAPSDSLPADALESGKAPADVQAAAVFGGSAAPAAPLAPPAPPAPPALPPIPPAPPAIPPAPGAALTPVERDTAGVPYDARIHNKSRTKKQDGTWKLAKGIDSAVVAAVLAEIKGAPAAPLVPAAPAAPSAPPVPPPPPPSPTVGNAAPAAAVPSVISFRDVMKKVTENQTAGKLSKAQIDHALGQVGFKPDELAPLVMPANAQLLAAFNSLIDAALVPA